MGATLDEEGDWYSDYDWGILVPYYEDTTSCLCELGLSPEEALKVLRDPRNKEHRACRKRREARIALRKSQLRDIRRAIRVGQHLLRELQQSEDTRYGPWISLPEQKSAGAKIINHIRRRFTNDKTVKVGKGKNRTGAREKE